MRDRVQAGVVVGLPLSLLGAALLVVAAELLAAVDVLDFRDAIMPDRRSDQSPMPRPGHRVRARYRGDLAEIFGVPGNRVYQTDVVADARGFRNEQVLDRSDVVVVGDSFVHSPLVAAGSLLTSRLSERLAVTVYNLGYSGFGPREELDVLRRFGMGLQPKVVIWVFFEGNDLVDEQRTLPSEQRTFWHRSLCGALYDRAHRFRYGGILQPQANPPGCRYFLRSGEPRMVFFGFRAAPLSWRDHLSLGSVEAIIAEAAAMSASIGARFVLAFAPVKARVYSGLCDSEPDNPVARWQFNRLPTMLAGWAEEQGIPYVDLTAALVQTVAKDGATGALLYFEDDTHWTAEGHEVVANSLARLVAPWLDAAP